MSLIVSSASGVLILAGLFYLVLRTGLAGMLSILGIAGGFLVWFYRGRRSDLAQKASGDHSMLEG